MLCVIMRVFGNKHRMYEPEEPNMKVKLFHICEQSLWLKKCQLYVQRLHLCNWSTYFHLDWWSVSSDSFTSQVSAVEFTGMAVKFTHLFHFNTHIFHSFLDYFDQNLDSFSDTANCCPWSFFFTRYTLNNRLSL